MIDQTSLSFAAAMTRSGVPGGVMLSRGRSTAMLRTVNLFVFKAIAFGSGPSLCNLANQFQEAEGKGLLVVTCGS